MYSVRVCPFCKSNRFTVLLAMDAEKSLRGSYGEHMKKADKKIEGVYPIVRCSDCAFVYSRHLLDAQYLHMIYDKILSPSLDRDYVHSFTYLKAMTAIYRLLLFTLDEAAYKDRVVKILDYGAGWGQFLEVAKNPRNEVYGFETSPERNDYMRSRGITVFESREEILKNAPYDIICCNQVMEHIPDPKEVITFISEILHDDGSAWISAPFYTEEVLAKRIDQYNKFSEDSRWDEYPFTLNPFEHLNYFSPALFKRFIEAGGCYIHLVDNDYMSIPGAAMFSSELAVTEGVVKKGSGRPVGSNIEPRAGAEGICF